MPFTFLRPDETGTVVDDTLMYVVGSRGAGLRYGFTTGVRVAEGIVELINWRAEAMDTLWAIYPDCPALDGDVASLLDAVVQANGALDCTLSVDGGTTYLFWDGADWSAAGPTDWTTFRDLNLHLADIPRADNQLRFRIRVRRGTDSTKTPELAGLRIGYSLVPGAEVEDPHRTAKRLMQQARVRFREKYVLTAAAGLSSIDLAHPLEIESVVSVHNLTTDPKRQTDLANGFTGTVVSFTAAQGDGDIVEVSWLAKMSVRIADPDLDIVDENSPHVPLILIQGSTAEESVNSRFSETHGYYTRNLATSEYWNEQPPIPTEYRFNIWALAADENLALKMINSCYRYVRDLAAAVPVRMVNSGQEVELIDFTPVFANQTDTSEKLSAKTFTFILYVREWLGEVVTGPLAEQLVILLEE